MTTSKVFFDGIELFTIRDSCNLEINPKNSKRQWNLSVYAGENAIRPASYDNIISVLTAGMHSYKAEDGNVYQVEITNKPRVTGIHNGRAIIAVTLTESGFNEDADSDDIEVTGTFDGVAFKTKLSNYSHRPGYVGQFQRALTARIIKSPWIIEYPTWSLSIPDWSGPMPQMGETYTFNIQYTAKDGRTVTGGGTGMVVSEPSMSGGTLSVTLEEDKL